MSEIEDDVAAVAAAAVAGDIMSDNDTPPEVPFKKHKSDNPVWEHFKKSTKEEKARCDKCGALISCKGGNTGAMRNHLKSKHQLKVQFKVKLGTSASVADTPKVIFTISYQT